MQGGFCPGESLSKGFFVQGEVSVWGVSVQGALGQGGLCLGSLCPGASVHGRSLYRAVSVQGSLCPGGLCLVDLCPGVSVQGGLCLRGSLSRGLSVQQKFVQGGFCPVGISVQGVLCLWEGLCLGGLCPGGCQSRGSLSGESLSRGLCPEGSLSRGVSVGRPSPTAERLNAGGTHPTGMHSCITNLYALCRVIVPFSPTANAESWAVEAFSLCVFTSTKSPRGPPWNEGHRPKVRHETSVFEVPVQEQHEHSFFSSSTNTFITGSLYTVRGYRTSPALQTSGRGWAGSKAVHGMECSRARSLYWRSLSAGAAA